MLLRIRISPMSCNHCVRAVLTSLTPVEGITRLEVGIGWAEIGHDGRVTLDQVRAAISVAGYEVEEERVQGRRPLPVL